MIEQGARLIYLSDSIVAREYGIPAVLAVENATLLIRSGQTITMDGSASTVIYSPIL